MSEKELRDKYGGKLAKAINRAIRAEMPGGNAALDKLTQLAGPALHSGWYEPNGKPTVAAAAYFKHKHDVVDKLETMVRSKWDIPVDYREGNPRARKTGGRKTGGRKTSGRALGGRKTSGRTQGGRKTTGGKKPGAGKPPPKRGTGR